MVRGWVLAVVEAAMIEVAVDWRSCRLVRRLWCLWSIDAWPGDEEVRLLENGVLVIYACFECKLPHS